MNGVILLLSVVAGLCLVGVGFLLWIVARQDRSVAPTALLQQEIDQLRRQSAEESRDHRQVLTDALTRFGGEVNRQLEAVTRQMVESQKSVGDRLESATRVVGEVQKNLGELGQASQKIFDVGKDISSLHDILRAPKMRGGLGEFFLGDLLAQVLPARHFTLQHGFRGGQVVDAVVRLGDRLVPVDAKFPLENFRRLWEAPDDESRRVQRKRFVADVKKHVDAIATKYILPDEGTYDFAMMYIPAENVYYECIIKDETPGADGGLLEYALAQRVIPVSPGSFYAYLQALALGLRGFQIEENARAVMEGLDRLRGDFKRFSDEFSVVGKHLVNAKTKYDDAAQQWGRVGDKLVSLTADRAPLPTEGSDTPTPLLK